MMKRLSILFACLMIASVGSLPVLLAEDEVAKPTDTRLEQKVAVKTIGKPLGDFLKALSDKTGVKMTARKGVADDKLAVFVKDLPLSELQDAIRQVLHLQCTRKGKVGEWKYEFWMDLKTKQEIERLKQEDARKLRSYVDKLVKQLAEMEAGGEDPVRSAKALESISEEEIEKMMTQDPERLKSLASVGELRRPGVAAAITVYARLNRAQLDALWRGQRVTLRMSDIPADLQRKLHKRCMAWADQGESMHRQSGEEAPAIVPESVQSFSLRFKESALTTNRPTLYYRVAFDAAEASEGQSVISGYGAYLDTSFDERATDTENAHRFFVDDTPDGSETEHSDALRFDIQENTHAYEVMEYVFDKAGISIVSDFFTRLTQSHTLPHFGAGYRPKWVSADGLLAFVADSINLRLDRAEDLRLLTSNTWHLDRDREIPERLVARWHRAKKQYGGLRLHEAIELASLTLTQLNDLELYGLGNGWSVASCQKALKAVGLLNAEQWKEAMGPNGSPAAHLNDRQFALVLDWVRNNDGPLAALDAETPNAFDTAEKVHACTLKIQKDVSTEKSDVSARWEFALEAEENQRAMEDAIRRALARGETSFEVPWLRHSSTLDLKFLNFGTSESPFGQESADEEIPPENNGTAQGRQGEADWSPETND